MSSISAPRLTCQHQSPGPGAHSPKQPSAKLRRQTAVPGGEQRESRETKQSYLFALRLQKCRNGIRRGQSCS